MRWWAGAAPGRLPSVKDFDPRKSFVGEAAEHNDDVPRAASGCFENAAPHLSDDGVFLVDVSFRSQFFRRLDFSRRTRSNDGTSCSFSRTGDESGTQSAAVGEIESEANDTG